MRADGGSMPRGVREASLTHPGGSGHPPEALFGDPWMGLLPKTNGSTAALDAERDQLHLWMWQTMSHSSLLITSHKKFKSCLVV